MSRRPFLVLAVMLALLGLTGCSALGVLNAILPKDGGSRRAAENVAYGADPRQRLDVYVPNTGANHGVVVFVYGGSWNNGSRSDYGFVGRAFASRGFVTVIGDYRLVPEHPYPDFVRDCAKIVAWAQANAARFNGNADRIFLVGHSAGAYNALATALNPEFLQAEGVAPQTVKGVAGLAGPYDFLPLDDPASIAAFGHLSPEDQRKSQPIHQVFADRYAPPAFLATGADDTTVRSRNTARLAKALESAGHRVESRTYPDLGHAGLVLALSRPLRGKAPVLDEIVAFFQRL